MILPAPADRGLVVFRFFRDLSYVMRLAVSLALVAGGFAAQFAGGWVLGGAAALFAGSLLLVVRGYDNRVDYKAYDPSRDWQAVPRQRLDDLLALDERMRTWDQSALDVTSPVGCLVFLGALGLVALALVLGDRDVEVLGLDAAVLVLPHFVTGVRRVLRTPALLVRVKTLKAALEAHAAAIAGDEVTVLMLFRGTETKIPEDAKFRLMPKGAPPEFLGLYGQVCVNTVSGASWPYFYAVLVAKAGSGLKRRHEALRAPEGVTVEWSEPGPVEVLVIRQTTTKTSGYHTPEPVAAMIFGLALAEARAGLPPCAAGAPGL